MSENKDSHYRPDRGETLLSGGEATEAAALTPTKDAEASLWVDAWRSLRRNPWFVFSAVLLLVLLALSLIHI